MTEKSLKSTTSPYFETTHLILLIAACLSSLLYPVQKIFSINVILSIGYLFDYRLLARLPTFPFMQPLLKNLRQHN